ncbi:MAG: AsnC family transcriptional regulator [Alphaproteobacteria bacterium]
MTQIAVLDDTDRRIIGALQGGFPVIAEPFAEVALRLGLDEDDLIARIDRLREEGVLTRFGPLFNVERLGGTVTLAAMGVPADRFDEVAQIVNVFPEVAHNYARDHALNMWFVIAAESRAGIDRVIGAIEEQTGIAVLDMPKLREFFVDLRFAP